MAKNPFRYGGSLASGRRTRFLKKWPHGRFHFGCQPKIAPELSAIWKLEWSVLPIAVDRIQWNFEPMREAGRELF
jgi:hypothetical protein